MKTSLAKTINTTIWLPQVMMCMLGQKTHSVWCITGQIGASSSCETVENLLEHQHTSNGDELDF